MANKACTKWHGFFADKQHLPDIFFQKKYDVHLPTSWNHKSLGTMVFKKK